MEPESDIFFEATKLLAGVWKRFPADRQAFCDALRDVCKGHSERAEWLIQNRNDFDEYPGMATITRILLDRFEPVEPISAAPQASNVCPKCSGCGWIYKFAMHSIKRWPNGSLYTEMESITEDQFDSFNGGKLDPKTQRVYSGVTKCDCGHEGSRLTPMTREQIEQHNARWPQFVKEFEQETKKNPESLRARLAKQVFGALQREGVAETPRMVREPGDESEYDRSPKA